MPNPHNKSRKILDFKQFIKNGEKSQKTSGTNETGEAELTKDHYSGEKKGDKGIATLDENTNEETDASVDSVKEITEDKFDEMLGVLPPIYFTMMLDDKKVSGFAVSEPADEKDGIPTFNGFFKSNGKHYECVVTLKNPAGKNITYSTYNNYEFTKGNTAELI